MKIEDVSIGDDILGVEGVKGSGDGSGVGRVARGEPGGGGGGGVAEREEGQSGLGKETHYTQK